MLLTCLSRLKASNVPAVCIRYMHPRDHGWRPHDTDWFQAQCPFAKPVDNVAESLPGHHLDNRVAHVIGDTPLCTAELDASKRVREGLRRRPGHPGKSVSRKPFPRKKKVTNVNIRCKGIPSFSAQ